MSRGGRVALLALTGALAITLVALALMWRHADRLAETEALAAAEREATQVASDIAVAMTTYDHKMLEQDFAWVEEDGTESFEETFAASTRPIRQLITRTRASAEGRVTDAAGTATDRDQVTVLLFVDQVIERVGERGETGESTRVVMEMRQVDGRWLVDDVQLR
jgi:Mce-associated membrane protein